MMTVWKFTLQVTDEQTIEMPQGAEILHVGQQVPVNVTNRHVFDLGE